MRSEPSICRVCINQCAITVDLEGDRVVAVRGAPEDPVYGGYTCVKGRSQPEFLRHESRLLHSLRRSDDGVHKTAPSGLVLDEVADKLAAILERHGPRAVAGYAGTMAMVTTAPTATPMYTALLDALGTPMRFDPNTIDKGGKQTAASFLGSWNAPSQGFDRPEAIMLVGINPLMTHTGFPAGSPARWLAGVMSEGCRLIVIDPRVTDVARKADWHLAVRPGHDVAVLAAIIRVILDEGLHDVDFVNDHVAGVDELHRAVACFDPRQVAERAGIAVDDLVASARCYARAARGYAMAGTGPNMGGSGTLVEYLVLVVETLCGRWLRAGEPVTAAPTLLPTPSYRAQASGPDAHWATGTPLRVRGLHGSRAGVPTAALPEEILTPGEGRVRALISWGGNPAVAFPDQRRTVEALEALELFVQIDPWYSESARLADYVIAPTMPLEAPSTSVFLDALSGRATGYGLGSSYAHYTPALTAPPAESDLLHDWEVFHGLLMRLGHPMRVRPFGHGSDAPLVDVDGTPTTDELLELLTVDARVPLAAVKAQGGGSLHQDASIVVGPADPSCSDRLDVGSTRMLADLATWRRGVWQGPESGQKAGLRLLCRREAHTYNTSCHDGVRHRGPQYNPAYLSGDELTRRGLVEGQRVLIRSEVGEISAFVHVDRHLPDGVVSMAFGYGSAAPGGDPAVVGSSPSRLVSVDTVFDPYTGQPRMTNIPVELVAQ